MTLSRARPLAAVVAMGRNGAIGRANALPWTMPTDLARFRALTKGKPMIMGRRTFESIGRALPGRESIVVSRHRIPEDHESVYAASDPAAALALAEARAEAMGAREVTLIGGAALFEAMMPYVDRQYLTIVDLQPEADTFLAAPDPILWRETARLVPERQPGDEADCTFLEFERI